MKKTIISPVDMETDQKTLFIPIKEFPIERLILLTSSTGIVKAESIVKELEKLSIPASIVRMKESGNPWEDFFVVLKDIIEGQNKSNFIINISTSDRISQCALTNAAHVNGIKAIAVIDGKIKLLPILKFSYSSVLLDKKMKLMHHLAENNCFHSLEDLAKKTGMSLQLVSYHINGTPRSLGLNQLELIDTEDVKGRTKVCISAMGRLFMQGYIK